VWRPHTRGAAQSEFHQRCRFDHRAAEISTHCATANLHFISTRAVIRGGGGGDWIQQQANHEPIRSIDARDLHYQFKSAISAPPPTIKAPLLISLPFPRHTRDWH